MRTFIRPENDAGRAALVKYMEQILFGLHDFLKTHVGITQEVGLRELADEFMDTQISKHPEKKLEQVIAEEMPAVAAVAAKVKPRTEGKTAMLFVGGSRAHHYQELFKELGMKTIAAGYEFAHRDDYEGRHVLPDLKVDADSRNIEEITVEPEPERFRPRKAPEQIQALEQGGLRFKHYAGMAPDMEVGTLIIDDLNQYEAEKLVEIYKPHIFCAGIKEKFSVQKMGVPMKQLHSYDSGGPYAGFRGAVNFYREVDRLVNSRVWSHLKAPWQEHPELSATYVWE